MILFPTTLPLMYGDKVQVQVEAGIENVKPVSRSSHNLIFYLEILQFYFRYSVNRNLNHSN